MKGGIADLEAAARIVIGDWNGGKMRHYALPPGFDPSNMVDVDALRKELIDDADINDESMILEDGEQDQSTMKLE